MTEEKQDQIMPAVVQAPIEIKLPTAEQLLEAGVHFGHKTSKWNPKMKPYIFGARNAVHIIDLEKTLVKFKEAMEFIAEVVRSGGVILFVGTKPAAKKIIKDAAESVGMPYVTQRWLGGTLTNFKTISKRLNYYKDLESQTASGELAKYTKKEQMGFQKELESLKKNLEGIKNLIKLPQAVLVVDLKEDKLALREAKNSKIPIIGICDTTSDPSSIEYPIPGNDDATPAIKIVIDTIVETIKKNRI